MIPDSFELLHLLQNLCASECWIRPWLEDKAAIFPVAWFLKRPSCWKVLWEEEIALSISEPVRIRIGKSKGRLAHFFDLFGRAMLAAGVVYHPIPES